MPNQRSTRYLFARRVAAPDAKVMALIPIFTRESMSGIRGTVHIRSLPNVSNAFKFLGPNAALEYNMYLMYAPWSVVSTFSGGVGADNELDHIPHPPLTTAEWDMFFRRLLLEFGTDGNEFYGANPDGTSTAYDPVRNAYVRRRGTDADPSAAAGDGDDLTTQGTQDEPMTFGPTGIQRMHSVETILTSDAVVSVAKNVSGLAAAFSAASAVNDIVFSDQQEFSIDGNVIGPGYVMLGVVRHSVGDTEGHSAGYAQDAPTTNIDMARNRALNILFGGDMERAQWLVRNGTGYESDYIRSLLFGGDNFLEDAGAYTPVDFFDDGSWFRDNEIVVTGKLFVGHATPYSQGVL